MNFVDVQPKSFLDYAWTSPSSSPITKPGKANRKQNRCCDQCRKGKRACDAIILEDALLFAKPTGPGGGEQASLFHYSDAYGPLAPCGNCEKTKKVCTFEWLRTQRCSHLQETTQQGAEVPTAKRRRKSSGSPSKPGQSGSEAEMSSIQSFDYASQTNGLPDTANSDEAAKFGGCPIDSFGIIFADFPSSGVSVLHTPDELPWIDDSADGHLGDALEEEPWNPRGYTSAMRLSIGSRKGSRSDTPQDSSAYRSRNGFSVGSSQSRTSSTTDSVQEGSPASEQNSCDLKGPYQHPIQKPSRKSRKKRGRSSSGASSKRESLCALSVMSNHLFTTANRTVLVESLLRTYHHSFEKALSCWLTERTCPYDSEGEVSTTQRRSPSWNYVYHRVLGLDRIAAPKLGHRRLTLNEERAATRALNIAVFAFAAQWPQSGSTGSRYPFHRGTMDYSNNPICGRGVESGSRLEDIGRKLRVEAWHEAQMALQEVATVESFRVVLAHIVFSLIERPSQTDVDDVPATPASPENGHLASTVDMEDELEEWADLLSKLRLTVDEDDPPLYLEQGVRQIHSLRSKVSISSGARKSTSVKKNGVKFCPGDLGPEDRETVELLFWLAVMFDTLSSAIYKRPLVISEEDSDIYKPKECAHGATYPNEHAAEDLGAISNRTNVEGHWDDHLLAQQEGRVGGSPLQWPCSLAQATSLLCDAAPVKILLFRKVTRIRTSLSRNIRGPRIEHTIKSALDVYCHWEMVYAPFVRSCIEKHNELPPSVKTWYICLVSHWYLGTLLLADVVELVDNTQFGVASRSQQRVAANFVRQFRWKQYLGLSDIARRTCLREESALPACEVNVEVTVEQDGLMAEPWTAVLTRAFVKAGVGLLESVSTKSTPGLRDMNEAFKRANACAQALANLGVKSERARAAAAILSKAINERQKYAR